MFKSIESGLHDRLTIYNSERDGGKISSEITFQLMEFLFNHGAGYSNIMVLEKINVNAESPSDYDGMIVPAIKLILDEINEGFYKINGTSLELDTTIFLAYAKIYDYDIKNLGNPKPSFTEMDFDHWKSRVMIKRASLIETVGFKSLAFAMTDSIDGIVMLYTKNSAGKELYKDLQDTYLGVYFN